MAHALDLFKLDGKVALVTGGGRLFKILYLATRNRYHTGLESASGGYKG